MLCWFLKAGFAELSNVRLLPQLMPSLLEPHTHKITLIVFLMVKMASGIARGRVRQQRTRCMAAINPANRLSDMHPWFIASFFWYWNFILWSTEICQNKVDQCQVTILRADIFWAHWGHMLFFKLPANQVYAPAFRLDQGGGGGGLKPCLLTTPRTGKWAG